ncbi:MAG: alpha/beta family hydrolase [Candidatus Hodarchaeales archaeon]
MELLFEQLNLTETIGITVKINVSNSPDNFIILAHGKFNNMDYPLLEFLANELSAKNTTVVRFNFPFVENKDPEASNLEMLEKCFLAVIERSIRVYCQNRQIPFFMGGKSLGALVSARIFETLRTKPQGMVFLGFPLHLPNNVNTLRDKYLYRIDVPTLFIQGTNDPYCSIDILNNILPQLKEPTLELINGGGHSYEGAELLDGEVEKTIFRSLNSWILNRFSRV